MACFSPLKVSENQRLVTSKVVRCFQENQKGTLGRTKCLKKFNWPWKTPKPTFTLLIGQTNLIRDKVFKSGLSTFCGLQPLKNLSGSFKCFKGCLPQNLLSPYPWVFCLIWNLKIYWHLKFLVPSRKDKELQKFTNGIHCKIFIAVFVTYWIKNCMNEWIN